MAKNKPYTNPPRDVEGFFKERSRVNRQFRREEDKAAEEARNKRLSTTTIRDRLENLIGLTKGRADTREANIAADKARKKVRNRNEGQRKAGDIKAKYPSKGSR